ncbi:MAG: NPCBM/NEW2 domain-containing protein [Planctomycetes bacterium]|nr:NPCBM/NEW2 domain-containing protein [Planctomycetota bacterium]
MRFTRGALTALLALACLCLAPARGAHPASWTLSTADTSLALEVRDDAILIARLASRADPHDWAGGGMPLPLPAKAIAEGRNVELRWRFAGGALDERGGRLVLSFACEAPRLALRSIWRARPGRGPVEHSLELENLSGGPLTALHQDSLTLDGLSVPAPAEAWWIRRGGGNASTQGGTLREPVSPELRLRLASDPEDGASPVPWLAVHSAGGPGGGRGLYVGWEFSGLGRIEIAPAVHPGRWRLDAGLLPDFKTDVEPGEALRVPAAFVGCFAGDMDEGSYSLHRFIVEKLRPPLPAGPPDPILAYNLYLDAGGNAAREDDVLRCAELCRRIGFEAFLPDAMWFPHVGDWRWDPARFPRGMGPIEEYVHSSGMRLALWCAWTNAGLSEDAGALSVRGPAGRPEWLHEDYGPEWRPGPFTGGRLCLACPEARAWAIEKTRWLVAAHKLDYLKHDIGPITTRCNKTSHRHRHGTDASYWAALGYYEVMERLREAFPALILENCSGGGHLKDFGVVQRSHYTVTTDTLSNLPDRQSIYDSTFAFPPLLLQAYTYDNYYPVPGDGPGTFLWRSAMMGAWQIDPTDAVRWTEEELESAARSAEIYKEWIRPMLADAKVHHVLPRPDGVRWDGLFYFSPSLRRGTLYVFRPDAPEERLTVRLKGLEGGRRYRVGCEDGSVAPGVRSGEHLVAAGLDVRLPERFASDLVYIEDEAVDRGRAWDPPGLFRLGKAEASSDPFDVSARFAWEPSAGARSYRLVVSAAAGPGGAPAAGGNEPGRLAERLVARPATGISGLPPGRELRWRVEAVSRGGARWSEGEPGSLSTPCLAELKGVVFVSDLPWSRATAGAGNPVRRDFNYHGKQNTVGGKRCPKGVWTHSFDDGSPADVAIDIAGKGYAVFAAEGGIEGSSGGGTVELQVLLDGAVAGRSPVLRPGAVHRFHVDVSGAKEVTLRVLNGGDGHTCDHAAWGLARLLEAGAKDPFVEAR